MTGADSAAGSWVTFPIPFTAGVCVGGALGDGGLDRDVGGRTMTSLVGLSFSDHRVFSLHSPMGDPVVPDPHVSEGGGATEIELT